MAEATAAVTSPIRDKLGSALDGGFVVIPSVMIRHQHELGLDSEQMVVLFNLLANWWDADRLPLTRTETIATRTGMSRRTVQRRIKQLECKRMLRRVEVQRPGVERGVITGFDLSGIVEKLQALGAAEGEMKRSLKR